MKRIALIAMSALLFAVLLAACAKDKTSIPPAFSGEAGYLAVRVNLEKPTRGSGEQTGLTQESKLVSLYLVTFNSSGSVAAIPDGGRYIALNAAELQTAQSGGTLTKKVAGSSRLVMAVANPGPQMLTALNSLTTGSTFASFNAAITGDANDIKDATRGFAMISCASDASLAVGARISDALVPIVPAVVDGSTYVDDAAAMAAATASPVDISIERLATKIVFKPLPANVEVLPAGASFAFSNWTVDVLNDLFQPFTEKTVIGATHTGTHYKYNFYTRDLNYADVAPPAFHTGLSYAVVNPTTKNVELPWNDYAGWQDAGANNSPLYLTENTMDGSAQRYGNVTRIVIKGRYAPAGFTAGADWFSFGGANYQTLADLQAAYNDPAAAEALKDACKAFATQMGSTDFAGMTASDLAAKAPNGGEWAKVPADGRGIRFYQGAQNYWFYEIRHNGEAAGTMEYSKYGVVRNNWYNCTLNRVSGPGTPWYPDPRNPGNGDPDPTDPIDDAYGYIGIEITPAPWIVWENGMTI